jgi:hypothetical protein
MASKSKGSRYIEDVLAYSKDLLSKKEPVGLSIKDILGFDISNAANTYLPNIRCIPITTLLPLYDRVIVGIPKIEKVSHFDRKVGMTINDVATLAHEKRLILFADIDCEECLKEMSSVVQELTDNDVPMFFAGPQEKLLAIKGAEKAGVDADEGERILKDYTDFVEVPHLGKSPRDDSLRHLIDAGILVMASPSLEICSSIKPTAEYIREVIELAKKGASYEFIQALLGRLSMVPDLFSARALNSTLSINTGCRYVYGIEESSDSTVSKETHEYVDPLKLEFIEKKLRVAYSDDISLKDYAQVFDSNATAAMRNIVQKIISGESKWDTPFTRLHELVGEYNESVDRLAARKMSRGGRILYVTSDILKSNAEAVKIAIAGVAEKYLGVPDKAWECVGLPAQYRQDVLNWLRDRTVTLESRLAGVSSDVVHLYRARTCLDHLKNSPVTAQSSH